VGAVVGAISEFMLGGVSCEVDGGVR
jgi:hypothetical protein